MPSIDERPAYGRYHEHRRHLASFCGTGNNVQFLSDATGNRRWLPFEVESISSPRQFPLNYAGIYAQAYRLWRDGFQYWFSQAEIQRLSMHNEQFETPRLERELVDMYFRKPRDYEAGEFMPTGCALQIIGGNTTQKLNPVMIGRAFADLGFTPKRFAHSRGYVVVRRSGVEISEHMKTLAVTDDR
jgi:predicted P-loop ATPase